MGVLKGSLDIASQDSTDPAAKRGLVAYVLPAFEVKRVQQGAVQGAPDAVEPAAVDAGGVDSSQHAASRLAQQIAKGPVTTARSSPLSSSCFFLLLLASATATSASCAFESIDGGPRLLMHPSHL